MNLRRKIPGLFPGTLFTLLLVFLMAVFISAPLGAEIMPIEEKRRGSFFFSFNYPGLGIGWRGQRHSVEFKGYFDGTNWGAGPRFNYYWGFFDRGSLYTGFEYLVVDFEGEISKGDGIVVGISQGIELFFEPSTSLRLDIGPYQVNLEDSDSSVTEDGWEAIMNIGLNIYF